MAYDFFILFNAQIWLMIKVKILTVYYGSQGMQRKYLKES